MPQRMAKQIATMAQNNTELLEAIKYQIKPKCRHLKKYRDRDSKGNWYCTNCNLDL